MANARAEAREDQGKVVAGRFKLIRLLSRGGMGSVWVALHLTLGTEVAIKFLTVSGEDQAEAFRRFEREANVVARLRSPHVVQIMDYGIDSEHGPFLVMELLHGQSLRERLARPEPIPLDLTVRIVIQVCRALQKAHKAGVVHRDIKPANIYLCDEDDGLLVKVLDFGIAKANQLTQKDGEYNTETGAVVGTPHYMSPEQALGGRELDGRSDLFSLGIVAWRCVTGRLPHDTQGSKLGVGEILIASATRPVPAPSTLMPHLPPELDAWFLKALSLDREGRFANAADMASALAKALNMGAPDSHPAFSSGGSRPLVPIDIGADFGDDPGTPSGKMRIERRALEALAEGRTERSRSATLEDRLASSSTGAVIVVEEAAYAEQARRRARKQRRNVLIAGGVGLTFLLGVLAVGLTRGGSTTKSTLAASSPPSVHTADPAPSPADSPSTSRPAAGAVTVSPSSVPAPDRKRAGADGSPAPARVDRAPRPPAPRAPRSEARSGMGASTTSSPAPASSANRPADGKPASFNLLDER